MYGNRKIDAVNNANQALALLKNPKGWKVTIWEDMGWHMKLQKGGLSLHRSKVIGDFFALFNEDGESSGGSIHWTENYYNKDPNKVIARQLKVAKAFVRQCQKAIADIER